MTKTFKYWQWRTIFATMIGYAIFYFVRKNFSFAIPDSPPNMASPRPASVSS